MTKGPEGEQNFRSFKDRGGFDLIIANRNESRENLVSVEDLSLDNASERAERGRVIWNYSRKKNQLVAVWACGDARIILPEPTTSVTIRSIATAGDRNPYTNILRNDSLSFVLILAHHDGSSIEPGIPPSGCGGLKAKQDIKNSRSKLSPTEGWVDKNIFHEDVIIQACLSAIEVAKETGKRVIAATQDHRSGAIIPLAYYHHEGNNVWDIKHSFDPSQLMHDKYDPSIMYETGIKNLGIDKIPDRIAQQYLNNYSQGLQTIHEKYPYLSRKQEIQSPSMVVLSTDIRPFEIRYPLTTDAPNKVFKLGVPREKLESGYHIPEESLQEALLQALYPIEHFPSVNTIFIETGSTQSSKELALKFLNSEESAEKAQKWLNNPNHQILVGATKAGVSSDIKVLKI